MQHQEGLADRAPQLLRQSRRGCPVGLAREQQRESNQFAREGIETLECALEEQFLELSMLVKQRCFLLGLIASCKAKWESAGHNLIQGPHNLKAPTNDPQNLPVVGFKEHERWKNEAILCRHLSPARHREEVG